jgi:hypothetical protein
MRRFVTLSPGRLPLTGVLFFSAVAIVATAVVVLLFDGGWHYYATPLRVRAYHPAHRVLRPSGSVGQTLGVVGLAMMTVPVLYAVRKRWRRAARLGGMKRWLDVHIFCGTVGPVLVTFHSAMKFNGVISVAYWSMVAVMLSGFVGRYLYVRIPRSLRGTELSYAEIEAKAAGMLAELASTGVDVGALSGIRVGRGLTGWRERSAVYHRLLAGGLDADRSALVVRLAAERASLLRRLAQLSRTRRLFGYWHVFHLPLVYVMFAIALVHVALAVYFGYASFLRR